MKTTFTPGTTPQQRQAVLDFARQLRAAKGDRVVKVLLIGSVARGDFGADSDIDVAVVAKSVDTDFKWDVWGIGTQVSLAQDVVLNVHIYSEARWAQMQHSQCALWRNIERDGIDLTPAAAPAA